MLWALILISVFDPLIKFKPGRAFLVSSVSFSLLKPDERFLVIRKIENIKDIKRIPGEEVIYIHRIRKLKPMLDVSGREIEAMAVQESGITGRGVLVGVVDTGVFMHNDLRWPDGSPKIFALWDQTEESYKFGYPHGFTYGLECQAEKMLDCPSKDKYGHGTHIMGILASEDDKYKGIAPDALFVFVKTSYWEDQVIDACDYISRYAEKFSLPWVINLSLGGHFGPHDGTSPFELALSQFVKPGGIIVVAAGNEGNVEKTPIHVGGHFSGTASFKVKPVAHEGFLELWTEYGKKITAFIILEKGREKLYSEYVEPGTVVLGDMEKGDENLLSYTLDFSLNPYPLSPRKSCIYFIFKDVDLGSTITVILNSEETVQFDAWVGEGVLFTGGEGPGEFFPPTPQKTVSVPATSPYVIAVGSYVTKRCFMSTSGFLCQDATEGDISKFSSVGYVNGDGVVKPEITAPGELIVSCKAEEDFSNVAEGGEHKASVGTSQAAAHVSGAIALLLSVDNLLTKGEVEKIMSRSAKVDAYTGSTPNEMWGWGKLRVDTSGVSPRRTDVTPPEAEAFMEDGILVVKANEPIRVKVNGKTYWAFKLEHRIEVGDVYRITVEDVSGNVAEVELGKAEGCSCYLLTPLPLILFARKRSPFQRLSG